MITDKVRGVLTVGHRGRRRSAAAATTALVLLGAAGCGSAEEQTARQAADSFVSALRSGDAQQACDLLAPTTLEAVEALRPEGCEQALPSLQLPQDPVTEVQVWGDGAQARTAGDVLFLRELQDGWRVRAAGCTFEGEGQPYDCDLEGS